MKKLLIVPILALLLNSCKVKESTRNYTLTTIDSIVYNKIYKDTVILINGSTATIDNIVISSDSGHVINLKPIKVKKGNATVSAQIVNNLLKVEANCDSIQVLLQNTLETLKIKNSILESEKIKEPVKYIPDLYRWSFRLLIIEIIVLLTWLGYKIKSKSLFS